MLNQQYLRFSNITCRLPLARWRGAFRCPLGCARGVARLCLEVAPTPGSDTSRRCTVLPVHNTNTLLGFCFVLYRLHLLFRHNISVLPNFSSFSLFLGDTLAQLSQLTVVLTVAGSIPAHEKRWYRVYRC